MKRRLLVGLLSFIMILSLLPTAAFAVNEDGTITSDGLRYRITGDNTVSVISNMDDNSGYPDLPYDGVGVGQLTYSGEIEIPATIQSGDTIYSVTAIEQWAFYQSSITEITIPASIQELKSNTFRNCRSLTEVSFSGEGLEEIGEGAFAECVVLSNLPIPSTVTTIGSSAFNQCNALTSLCIPAGVTSGLVEALA